MENKEEYCKIFFAESLKTKASIEELRENFNNIEEYPFSIPTLNHGSLNIIIVWYSSPKDNNFLFSEDEYNMIYKRDDVHISATR